MWTTCRAFRAGFLLLGFLPASLSAGEEPNLALGRMAVGSCADQERPQTVWKAFAATAPDLVVLLGDNIYADTEDPEARAAAYAKLGAVPEFAELRRRVPFLFTWDDHDYGANDAGADYSKKEESKLQMLDFFGVPEDHELRRRPGVYQAKVFGPEGRRVQVILLDGRSFRSPLLEDPSPWRRYRPNLDPAATMLGEQQWAWLREQLEQPAEIRLIGSGVQVLSYANGFEGWKTLPLEQERLFAAIRETRAAGVVFISGDAHYTQIVRADGGVGYPLYELVSSGLTHGNAPGANRPSPLALYRPYGGINFGTIDFAWEGRPSLTLRSHDVEGLVVFEHRIFLEDLQPPTEVVK
jgi:alkaline phosphatase D